MKGKKLSFFVKKLFIYVHVCNKPRLSSFLQNVVRLDIYLLNIFICFTIRKEIGQVNHVIGNFMIILSNGKRGG